MEAPVGRVRCSSKRAVLAALERAVEPLRKRLKNIPQEAQQIFETAVQENILINGLLWQEVSEEDELRHGSDIRTLDDDLDECIKETASKRKQFPRKIVGHLARTMKAERESLKQYQPVVKSQLKTEVDSEQVSKEKELLRNASNISRDMSDTMKHLPAFMEKAEGLLQTLTLVPIMKQSQTNKAIFSTHTETYFQNSNEQALLFEKSDVTPTETEEKNLLKSRKSQKRKSDSYINRQYPKRRLHLGQ
ncbi:kinetochore-associated protein NSL1 homolog [Stegostoma tigrinum]|uniref:kinetochore-associated protein NSL1 homolog n=1 Tax=Stegostoma tigrinum TaxID=3053191 RepID=UPI00202B3BB4|nr:kinetochore-associated protein NSL1 homolog [Stegostoma tigrinum]XP_048391597.1 kinetochore-associated protein NSL1 homolog [Stegostoma tigrinum]XP_048391598.1 kinetochore-associated protein NSL1 homolog [Stegostoma tigrinum]XP_048391599.1 kinetochore-associated protein NSL1 homolog [Stegostoma tigrinum]XP_048391600.1 kinetochore-associated protein NSL1 homolog [Stegostoma tigrinum]XP_048391601.1 kinetochore-associated protein NSL1 homolog [Stegostoma tigrinum]XP_048391602.1 kinetochore-as